MHWYRSLYWRIALGFVVFLAAMLVVQAVLYTWVVARSGRTLPGQTPSGFAQTVANDLATALERDPHVNLDVYIHEQFAQVAHPLHVFGAHGGAHAAAAAHPAAATHAAATAEPAARSGIAAATPARLSLALPVPGLRLIAQISVQRPRSGDRLGRRRRLGAALDRRPSADRHRDNNDESGNEQSTHGIHVRLLAAGAIRHPLDYERAAAPAV